MVVQEKLNADEIKDMKPLNRQMYEMITSFGDDYEASDISPEIAEAINGATNRMAATLGLAKTEELSAKLVAIKGKANIKDKDGLKEYFRLLLKKRIKEALIEAGLDPEVIEELEAKEEKKKTEQIKNQDELQRNEAQDIEKEKEQDEEHNELFLLTVNGKGDRLLDKGVQDRSLFDRQKAIAERTLRVLEAMEKAADAIQKGEKIPEMDLSYLKDLTPREFKQQMRIFEDFGLDPFVIGEDGQIRENPERELTLETVTPEDLENEDVAFAIPYEKMQTKEWREMAKRAKESCRRQGIESEYEPEYEGEIGDSAIEITPESNSTKIVDDEEMSL